MPKKSSDTLFSAIPKASGGIQVNCCRKPPCKNFLVSPTKNKKLSSEMYRLSGSDHYKLLKCQLCKTTTPLKSNKAVHQELARVSRNLAQAGLHPCPNSKCNNHNKPFQLHSNRYHRNGYTNAGRQRVICRLCKKPFTLSDNRRESRRSKEYRDLLIFRMLVNQGHIKCIARVT